MGAFGIQFAPRTVIKAQVLADFIMELTELEPIDLRTLIPELALEDEEWKAYYECIKAVNMKNANFAAAYLKVQMSFIGTDIGA